MDSRAAGKRVAQCAICAITVMIMVSEDPPRGLIPTIKAKVSKLIFDTVQLRQMRGCRAEVSHLHLALQQLTLQPWWPDQARTHSPTFTDPVNADFDLSLSNFILELVDSRPELCPPAWCFL